MLMLVLGDVVGGMVGEGKLWREEVRSEYTNCCDVLVYGSRTGLTKCRSGCTNVSVHWYQEGSIRQGHRYGNINS